MTDQWRTERVPSVAGGLNYSRNPVLLEDDQAADELNVDHDDGSIKSTGGAIKMNNQVARKPGVLFSPDPSMTPLFIEEGKSVPVRSYGFFPYSPDTDIGGDFAVAGSTLGSQTFHARRGKSFNFEVSVKIPEETKLYAQPTLGANAFSGGGGDAHLNRAFGYDEGLDDCFVILQKGGDRTSPMSWFLGVVNVGGASSIGLNEAYELVTDYPVDPLRISNYCLVFGWFDSAGWGEPSHAAMRYDLLDPSASATGEYSTQSLRAVTLPHFVEPGREYHVAVKLSLDTAAMGDSAWNEDGFFQVAVSEGLGPTRVYGYSRKNQLTYTDELEKGFDSQVWDTNDAETTIGRVEVEGPFGQRFVSELGTTGAATAGAWIFTDGGTWGASAAGEAWGISAYVKENTAAWVRLNLRNTTDGTSYVALWEWVDGVPVLREPIDTDLFAAYQEPVRDSDGWWRISAVRVLAAGDQSDDWQTLFYTSFLNADIDDEDPGTSTYVAGIQVERFGATDPALPSRYEPNDGLHVFKGPTDSLEYLTKYGIRYSSRDPMFAGLGYRMAPWQDAGFIPFGADSAPMEHGGFVMVDRSIESSVSLYPSGYELLISHAGTNTYVTLPASGDQRSLIDNRLPFERGSPNGPTAADWTGYGASTGAFNASALRGYRFVFLGGEAGASGALRGGIVTIGDYVEQTVPTDIRVGILGYTGVGGGFTSEMVIVQAFRWNQRPLILSEIRFYSVENEPTPPATILPTPDSQGNIRQRYNPSGTSAHARQRLAIFHPPPEIPRPPGGYPVVLFLEGNSAFTEVLTRTSLVEGTDDFAWDAVSKGWVFISVGHTGTDSSGTPTVGAFSPHGSSRWDDDTEYFPEKDAVWARQWLAEFADVLGINNDMVVMGGDRSGAEAAAYACLGADRAKSSGVSQVMQSTRVAGFFGVELRSWFTAYTAATSGTHWLDANGDRATTIGGANQAHVRQSSPSRVVREDDALVATTPVFLSYDEAATSTDFTRLASGDPALLDVITGATRDYWFGVTFWNDLVTVAAAFHNLNSELIVQDGLELASPDDVEKRLFLGTTMSFQHDAILLEWLVTRFPYPGPISARDYFDRRTQLSLRSEALLEDQLEPGIQALIARYPLDDGGGGVLRDTVRSLDAYLCPFGLGVSSGGSRGESQLFLSGEGESLQLDLSTNPVFQREFQNLQQSGNGGFAIEFTCVLPQAYYALNADPDGLGVLWEAQYAPHLASWELKDPDDTGLESDPQPILLLTHRIQWLQSTNPYAILRPCGFSVETYDGSDQENSGRTRAFDVFDGTDFVWKENADWVGKKITIQVGVQSTGTVDQYRVYLAATPARDLLQSGAGTDFGDQELSFFSAAKTIKRKDLVRSVVTIGGCHDAARLARGYTEANCRMIIDEVRVFGTAAPGSLAPTSGSTVAAGDGKLSGVRSMPARQLSLQELLQPLGDGVRTANVVDGSQTVTAPGQNQLYESEAEATLRSIRETYLIVAADQFPVLELETLGREVPEFYFISDVAAGGGSLTLVTPFGDVGRSGAAARSMRLIGYCDFSDDIRDKTLPLGRGRAYDPASSVVDDATITEDFFQNPCPLGVNWRFRVYSPVGEGLSSRFLPRWVRGLQSPRRNEILGLHHINRRILAGAQGSLFEVDDRWRDEGPTEDLTKSLAFRGRGLMGTHALLPKEDDRLLFKDGSRLTINSSLSLTGITYVYDAWVKLDRSNLYQTILWHGSEDTDPAIAGNSHDMQLWIRMRDGFPQLCLHSNATTDGSAQPDRSLWCAEGTRRIPTNAWVHVRWYLTFSTSGTVVEVPHLKVNGKTVSVNVNAVANGLSGNDWLAVSSLYGPGADARIILGVARDSFLFSEEDADFEMDEYKGLCVKPDSIRGYIHSLGGRLAQVAVTTSSFFEAPPPDFDPHHINHMGAPYNGLLFLAELQEGVGHKALDSGGVQYGVIHSHPFISLFHQMGRGDERFAFASFGNEVFIANGGKVVVEEEGVARFAGVPTPTSKPDFEIIRNPLWVENVAAFDPEGNEDTANDVSGDNDPVGASSVDDETPLLHYSTRGLSYLFQTAHSDMAWAKQAEVDPGADDQNHFMVFKCYLRMRNVAGRQILWSQKADGQSGRSLEIRDGKIGFYWWDSLLKKEVGVLTSSQVIAPGYVHYIYLRKGFPSRHSTYGNYLQSFWGLGDTRRAIVDNVSGVFLDGEFITAAGGRNGVIHRIHTNAEDQTDGPINVIEYLNTGTAFVDNDAITGTTSGATGDIQGTPAEVSRDQLVVRRFRKADSANAWATDTTFDAKTEEMANISAGTRNCIGFPTSDCPAPAGTTATGMVTAPGRLWNGLVGGGITGFRSFHEDMIGMIWQWGTGAPAAFLGVVYRISEIISSQSIVVVAEDGVSSVDFSSIASQPGGVFAGVNLVKSEDFDESTSPDEGNYNISLMGNALQGTPLSGITPFDGEVWCPGWATGQVQGAQANDFLEAEQTDMAETGTDSFEAEVYSAAGATGPLFFDGTNGRVFTAIDPEKATPADYVTTQPNTDLIVAPDEDESIAEVPDLQWRSVQDDTVLDGLTRVWVTFYDPANASEGAPSSELVVQPAGEDADNHGGEASILLTSIPVREGFWRRVYFSLIDNVFGFLVGEIQDDTSTSFAVTKTQGQIAEGESLRFDRSEPPRCLLVATSQAQMFYANLDGQPDGVIYSRPYNPHEVPRSYVLSDGTLVPGLAVMDTGDDEEITGMRDLQGRLIVFKRNAAWSVVAFGGVLQQQIVSQGVGCVAHQSIQQLDNRLFWIDVRGPAQFADTASAGYLGVKLEPYFRDVLDPAYLPRISAAINRNRDQYVFTSKRRDSDYTHERIALEFDHQDSRQPRVAITRYQDPTITAMSEVDSRDGGPRKLIGGSEEGFCYWMDREDVLNAGMGIDPAVHGAVAIVADRSSSPQLVRTTAALDLDLEGPRGVRLRWRKDGVDYTCLVHAATSLVLHADRICLDPLPEEGDTLTLGQRLFVWRSKHFSFQTPEQHKKIYYVDIIRAVQAAGLLYLDVFQDLSSVAYGFSSERTLDLTSGTREIDVGEAQFQKFYQVRLSTHADQSDIIFDVFELAFRAAETEPR